MEDKDTETEKSVEEDDVAAVRQLNLEMISSGFRSNVIKHNNKCKGKLQRSAGKRLRWNLFKFCS